LKLYEQDRDQLTTKAKVSPYAMKTKEELEKLFVEIPMNMATEWSFTPDYIRIALRYNVSLNEIRNV
jgi:hypothetical protein